MSLSSDQMRPQTNYIIDQVIEANNQAQEDFKDYPFRYNFQVFVLSFLISRALIFLHFLTKLLKVYIIFEFKRWVIVILFCFPNMMSGIGWITFSPISSQVQQAYDQSQFVVSLTSLASMFCYIVINFPSNYILSEKGLRIGVFTGIFFTIIGAWIRLFINYNFGWAILGQVLGGIAQPFILNAPTQIASVWFKPQQRQMATAILSLINVVGVGIGFLFPSFIVSGSYSENTTNEIYDLIFIQAIVITAFCLPTVIFFREKPPTPPRILNKDDTSYFGAVFIISGLFGSAIISTIVEKNEKYKLVIIICTITSILSYSLAMSVLQFENFALQLASFFLYGFFATPLIPISLEFACEVTFPIAETISSGLVFKSGQMFGVIQIVISTEGIKIDSQQDVYICMAVGIAMQILGLLFIFFVKEDLKRKQEEKKQDSLRQKDLLSPPLSVEMVPEESIIRAYLQYKSVISSQQPYQLTQNKTLLK